MIMPAQINGAYDEATGTYDFSRSFLGIKNQFRSVDLMCGNLETTLSGEEAVIRARKAQKNQRTPSTRRTLSSITSWMSASIF